MMVKRIAALGLVLLSMGGCSRLQLGSTAYSSLPSAGIPSIPNSAAPLGRDAALAPVVIPGTLLTPQVNNGRRGVNPTAALEASELGHSLTQPMHSVDYSQTTALANRPHHATGVDVTATGSTGAPVPNERDQAATDRQDYNREAAMDRLVKGGREAAKPICSGC